MHRGTPDNFLANVSSTSELQTNNAVKNIRRLFENLAGEQNKPTATKPPGHAPNRPFSLQDYGRNETLKELLEDIRYKEARIRDLESYNYTDETSKRFIDGRLAKELSELQELYEQVKVKRRSPQGRNPQEPRIASEAEAENEVEAERYRKSLIDQMDQEIANMKAGGFMDPDEEIAQLADASQPLVDEAEASTPSKNILMEAHNILDDLQQTTKSEMAVAPIAPKPADEFGESIDELDDGLIFEAYNDEGRELVEIGLHRRTVQLPSNRNSQLVFHQEEEKTHTAGQLIEPQTDRSTGYSSMSGESSTRSAAYSSASMDFEEDDEGVVVIERDHQDKIHRIVERISFGDGKDPCGTMTVESLDTPGTGRGSATPARQLLFIIAEIKATEKKYVKDLYKITNNFKPYIQNFAPKHLFGCSGYIFGNIESIYKEQMKFLDNLENCGGYIYGIIRCFLSHKSLFEKYQIYFRNKPKADIVIKSFHDTIKDMQDYFQEKLELSTYLLTPVQRLGKYILFLENIEKQLFKLNQPTEIVKEALSMMKNEMSRGNDAVAIESIVNSPISKLDYGSFKMKEQFSISKPKKMEAIVFLFENVLVFASRCQVYMNFFEYIDSIEMNDLRIASFNDYSIHLTDYTKSKLKEDPAKYTYVLEAKTKKIFELWTTSIEDILWQQLVAVKKSVTSAPRRSFKTGIHRRIKSAVK